MTKTVFVLLGNHKQGYLGSVLFTATAKDIKADLQVRRINTSQQSMLYEVYSGIGNSSTQAMWSVLNLYVSAIIKRGEVHEHDKLANMRAISTSPLYRHWQDAADAVNLKVYQIHLDVENAGS